MYRTMMTAICLGGVLSANSLQAEPLWSERYGASAQQKPAVTAPASGSGACVAGQRVDILSGGKWYPGTVRQGPDAMGSCLVAYDGYGANWDEWVSMKRLRTSVSGAAPAAPETAPSTQLPSGSYACYTFDGGRLNYAYTDIVIKTATSYSVGKALGTYDLKSSGIITFTGTLANATGSFSVKNSGKAEIKLVFNNDARASMVCTHSGR